MISIRGTTLILIVLLCSAIWFAISQHPDIAVRLILCAIAVFTITAVAAAILHRGKK